MSNLSANKYNIAWFKLAEFVGRRERERALGLYRLLVHSFQDKAYAHQLEADILLAFQDTAAALEKYALAAQTYAVSNQWEKAASLYEICISLDPHAEYALQKLCDLYELLHHDKRLMSAIVSLSLLYATAQELEKSDNLIKKYEQIVLSKVALYQYFVLELAQNSFQISQAYVKKYIEKTLELSLPANHQESIVAFLAQLKAYDDELHAYAQSQLQKYNDLKEL